MSKIKLVKLQKLFDTENEDQRYSSLLNGLLGEELACAVFNDYITSIRGACKIIKGTPSEVRPEGAKWSPRSIKKLDRWLQVSEPGKCDILYQTEIKNWTAHSLQGEKIGLTKDRDSVSKSNYNYYVHEGGFLDMELRKDVFKSNGDCRLTKAFLKMTRPNVATECEVMPLIIFWHPCAENGDKFFSILIYQ